MPLDVRFILATFALLAGAAVIETHKQEAIPEHPPIERIPLRIGGWTGNDVPIADNVRKTLGKGEFLSRVYNEPSNPSASVSLFLAYFPTQSTGDTIHSPENCLPGSGWYPLESGRTSISWPGRTGFEVNQYYVAKREQRALVIYWYMEHGREVASDYWAKFYLVADSVRWSRSDGALIRITSPIAQSESPSDVEQRLERFSADLVPVIESYLPH